MFRWNDEMVRLMADASERTDYYVNLARRMEGYFPEARRVCDAGCGIGYLACALAERVPEVTAVDCSPEAYRALCALVRRRGLKNVTPLLGDAAALAPGIPYDAMVFSFFGQLREILAIARAQCRGTVVIVKKNYRQHRFSLGRVPLSDETADDAADALLRAGIAFSREDDEPEMGQPLRSLDVAALFFRLYSRDEGPDPVTPEAVRARLTQTGDAEFPYYLPQKKAVGLLRIDTADIPPDWEERL